MMDRMTYLVNLKIKEKDIFSSTLQRIPYDTDTDNLIMIMIFSCVNELLNNFYEEQKKNIKKIFSLFY